MEGITPDRETAAFILAHRGEDVRALALRHHSTEGVDMPFALQQIDGWQRTRTKLPMWATHDGIIYPPHISIEQCSSEATALYKQRIVRTIIPDTGNACMADLTGGFGVDFSYMSQGFREAYYVERQQHLCDIARHNLAALGITNSHVVFGVSEDILPTLPDLDLIYIDPARRDINGKKTYAISDCTPDVTALLPAMLAKARYVIVKLSPMLDHHEAVRLLPGVQEVHIISVHNECKETLLVISRERYTGNCTTPVRTICVNDGNVFEALLNDNQPTPITQHPSPNTQHPSPNTQHPSPNTHHPSPNTQHPSPITQHPTPITHHPTPITHHPTPITHHPTPITHHPTPIIPVCP